MKKNVRILFFTLLLLVMSFAFSTKETRAAGKYMIKINKQQNVVTIYKDKGGKYKPYKAFVCSSGYATPIGTFHLKEKIRWHILDGPTYGQYCTRIHQGFLFHSVWYYEMRKPNTQSYIQYNRLGTTASHGCVRLTVMDAKWIYDNCPTGTKVVIYNSSNPGPLGKPKAIKVSGYAGWDPTDPAPANPWRNHKPKIIAKSQEVAYDSGFDVIQAIEATNSTGYSVKSLVKAKIYYKTGKQYKKVKRFDTKRPGQYKVIYRLTDEIKRKARKTVYYKVLTKVSVKKITLNKKKKTLFLGGKASKKKFTLKVKKIVPKIATYKKVTYMSSDTKIATVSQKGVVRAKKAGTVMITATATDGSQVSAKCKVTIRQYARKLILTAPATTVNVGESVPLTTIITPAGTTNKKVKYSSGNTTIATVNAKGIVKGLQPGAVTITAKTMDGSKRSASITIRFVYKYEKVITQIPDITASAGTTINTLIEEGRLPNQIIIKDEKENTTNANVTWTSGEYNADVAGKYIITGQVTLPTNWIGSIPVLSVSVTIENTGTATDSAVRV